MTTAAEASKLDAVNMCGHVWKYGRDSSSLRHTGIQWLRDGSVTLDFAVPTLYGHQATKGPLQECKPSYRAHHLLKLSHELTSSCCFWCRLQIAVIEFARNVLGIKETSSTEFDPATPSPAVVFMPEISTQHMGGTMRLGSRRTMLQTMNCISAKLYQKELSIDERHRHRWAAGSQGGERGLW